MRIRFLMLLAISVVHAGTAHTQTLRPVFQEFKKKAKGSFFVANNSIKPMRVVIEPASFANDATGKQTLSTLDTSNIHLKTSQQSFVLPPEATYEIYFEAECIQMPCNFAMFAKFLGGHTKEGVAVSINLPESVYICSDSAKNCRKHVRQAVFHQPN